MLVENLLERIFILDTIKNICDSREVIKISILTGVWKKLIPALTDDFQGFKISVKNNCRCGGNKRNKIRSGT